MGFTIPTKRKVFIKNGAWIRAQRIENSGKGLTFGFESVGFGRNRGERELVLDRFSPLSTPTRLVVGGGGVHWQRRHLTTVAWSDMVCGGVAEVRGEGRCQGERKKWGRRRRRKHAWGKRRFWTKILLKKLRKNYNLPLTVNHNSRAKITI